MDEPTLYLKKKSRVTHALHNFQGFQGICFQDVNAENTKLPIISIKTYTRSWVNFKWLYVQAQTQKAVYHSVLNVWIERHWADHFFDDFRHSPSNLEKFLLKEENRRAANFKGSAKVNNWWKTFYQVFRNLLDMPFNRFVHLGIEIDVYSGFSLFSLHWGDP